MPTLRDFLLANTTLPITGTYTYREHFESFISSVTAELGGEIVISPQTTPITISAQTTSIVLNKEKTNIIINKQLSQNLVIDVKETHIVIRPSC